MERLKFSNVDVVFQEVPDEVSLAINITGCPHKCKGCHSSYLCNYFGEILLDNLVSLVNRYKDLITCVCFMGGDQNLDELEDALKTVKDAGLKTCLYSGEDNVNVFCHLLPLIDYLKVGRYVEDLGGLSSKSTNQRFYKVGENLIDITERFYTQQP